MGSSRDWLQAALQDLAGRIRTGLQLDAEVISGLVSYCELAPPEDAREYLNNIVGPEVSQDLIREYLQRRNYGGSSAAGSSSQPSALRPYVKPPARDEYLSSSSSAQRKQAKPPTERRPSASSKVQAEPAVSSSRGGRKNAGKVAVSLAEAARGAVVFKQGQPCSCQARRHGLIGNCLSCGMIVCEQEGEGPCSFCGVLVLREGSAYAGLDGAAAPPPSTAEATAEAFAKRLVDYDRNSAARTTVIDDQSDYYEFEGNSWLSKQEKDVLAQRLKEKEEEEERRRKKVVVTFDLLGRKVVADEGGAPELMSEQRILRPLENRETHRIAPNPDARLLPVFVDKAAPPSSKRLGKQRPRFAAGFCLEISGRVQHSSGDLQPGALGGALSDHGENAESSQDYD